jgi:hypothetical protein
VSLPESTPDRPRGVLVRRPKTTIYTVLLGLTAAALILGSLIMFIELWHYGPPWTFPWNVPASYR